MIEDISYLSNIFCEKGSYQVELKAETVDVVRGTGTATWRKNSLMNANK